MEIKDIQFCRGFLLSLPLKVTVPERFLSIPLPNGYVFAYDQNLCVNLSVLSDKIWVLIAGRAIDVETGDGDIDLLSGRLLNKLQAGETAFFDYLDVLSGRFVIVFSLNGSVCVLNDACGLKSVFYSLENMDVVGSHADLVNKAVGAIPSAIYKAKQASKNISYRYGLPGIETPYNGIRILPPNNLIDLSLGKVRRYFPREPIAIMDVHEAISIVTTAINMQLHTLTCSGRNLLVSLTAGVDSRFTLATAKPYIQKLEFFTYRQPGVEIHAMDADVAVRIAQILGLRHTLIDVSIKKEDEINFSKFNAALTSNTYFSHARKIAFLYWKAFSNAETIHIRSNLAEIGRAFYQKSKIRKPLINPSMMVETYNSDLVGVKAVEQAFKDFYELSHFDEIYNYDPYDIFYWEHRMGTWHTHVVTESDPAFDTHILTNSRKILMAMLAVPFEQRRSADLFHCIIDQQLPELATIPVNPKNWKDIFQ